MKTSQASSSLFFEEQDHSDPTQLNGKPVRDNSMASNPMKTADEMLELVDRKGNVVGIASRRECHSNPKLLHRAVHVFVFTTSGELTLQRRSMRKDIQPGKWDTSVGGHINPGETTRAGAYREMGEELGITDVVLEHCYNYLWHTDRESELIETFRVIYDGHIRHDPSEIDEVKTWRPDRIDQQIGTDIFTPNFEYEWRTYRNQLQYYHKAETSSFIRK